MPFLRSKKVRRRYRRRPPPIERNPWARLMLRWEDRWYVLRPHQVAYYKRSFAELVSERGNTLLVAAMRTDALRITLDAGP